VHIDASIDRHELASQYAFHQLFSRNYLTGFSKKCGQDVKFKRSQIHGTVPAAYNAGARL
jgi:hypothetical protein